VEKDLLILSGYTGLPIFSGVPVAHFINHVKWFVDNCLSFCHFSFGDCSVSPSIYGF
jgi:hypothetical protein